MGKRFQAGIITANPTHPTAKLGTSVASGVWNLVDQLRFINADTWPTAGVVAERVLIAGGYGSDLTNVVDTYLITSAGNASDFGDLLAAKNQVWGAGSTTRAIIMGGHSAQNVIQYFTYASAGNATDFGDLLTVLKHANACANSTRVITGGGQDEIGSPESTDVIQYVVTASTGNATDFGDLSSSREPEGGGAVCSTTRGLFAGVSPDCSTNSAQFVNTIDYITMASAANAVDFGDLLSAKYRMAGISNATRGIWAGGTDSGESNVIQFCIIASTGNTTDFGDLTQTVSGSAGASGATKGTINGGITAGSGSGNNIDVLNISSSGNSTDFGDLTLARNNLGSASAGHAGCK